MAFYQRIHLYDYWPRLVKAKYRRTGNQKAGRFVWRVSYREMDGAKSLGKEAGLSLVELMVALTLSLLLLAGVTTTALNTKQSDSELVQASEQLENGRYAIEMIKNDLLHAGFFGQLHQLPTAPKTLPTACALNLAELFVALPLAVQGHADARAATPCIAKAILDSELLAIRRADTRGITLDAPADDDDGDGDRDDLNFGRTYIQTRGDRYVLAYCTSDARCLGAANCSGPGCADKLPNAQIRAVTGGKLEVFNLTQRDGATLAELRAYHVHVYYLRAWSGHAGDGIPTLVRLELSDGGITPKWVSAPLVEGVERMAFQYGVDHSNPPDGSPDDYSALPKSVEDWSRVVAIRINLLLRSLEQSRYYTEARAFDLGEGEVILPAGAGRYRRQVFSTLVRLGNLADRLELDIAAHEPS